MHRAMLGASRVLVSVAALAAMGACSDDGTGGPSGLLDSGKRRDTAGGGGYLDTGGASGHDAGGGSPCPPVAFPAETAGCTMTIRTPANCATVSIGAEIAWGADACHTPYYLQFTGNPPSATNYREIQVDTQPINALAWAEPLRTDHLSGLTSVDGWYHFRVCNAYETGCSASRAFRLE